MLQDEASYDWAEMISDKQATKQSGNRRTLQSISHWSFRETNWYTFMMQLAALQGQRQAITEQILSFVLAFNKTVLLHAAVRTRSYVAQTALM